jgi:Cu/Ag efflux pump CusA
MNGASGVRRVRSATAIGFSVVWVEFDWGTNIQTDRQIVAEKLGLVRGNLPPDIEPPIMAPQASAMGEVLFLAIRSEKHSLFDLRTMADTTIRRRLLGVEGVAQVTPIGGDVKQYQVVSPRTASLQHLRRSGGGLKQTNKNATAGIMVDGGQEFLVQGLGRVQQLSRLPTPWSPFAKRCPSASANSAWCRSARP